MGNSNNDDAYAYNIPNLDESKVKGLYKIGFIGESGTGVKTSLINRLRGIPFGEGLTSSSSSSFYNIKIKIGKKKVIIFQLCEPSCLEEYKKHAKFFLSGIDCAVIGYDINNRKSYEEAINYWYPLIKNEFGTCNLIFLMGNKIDLYKKDESIIEEAMDFAKSEKIKFYTISCKTDQGIGEFFDYLVINLVNK